MVGTSTKTECGQAICRVRGCHVPVKSYEADGLCEDHWVNLHYAGEDLGLKSQEVGLSTPALWELLFAPAGLATATL